MNALLCLDLGTTTGFAIRYRDGLRVSGSASFKPQRFEGGGMRYLRFLNWLDEVSLRQIDQVWFEEVRRHSAVDAAHVYGGLMASLTSWCEVRKIPYAAEPVGTIKRFITGKGNANKAAVLDAVRDLGHSPKDDNEADAIALLRLVVSREPR